MRDKMKGILINALMGMTVDWRISEEKLILMDFWDFLFYISAINFLY